MFSPFFIAFYMFSGTNLLARCPVPVPCFFAVFSFRKVALEIFSELDPMKAEVPIFTRNF